LHERGALIPGAPIAVISAGRTMQGHTGTRLQVQAQRPGCLDPVKIQDRALGAR
jgi:hypothetical protein